MSAREDVARWLWDEFGTAAGMGWERLDLADALLALIAPHTAAAALAAIPQGAHSAGDFGWNRYDSDDAHTLHLWADGKSYDVITPRDGQGCGCVRWGLLVQHCDEHGPAPGAADEGGDHA